MDFPKTETHKQFRTAIPLSPDAFFEGHVLHHEPGVLLCEIRKIGKDSSFRKFGEEQNYAARLPGMDDLALEAELQLHSGIHPEWKKLRIGIPLSELAGVSEVTVQYTGAAFQMIADGRLLDEEYPFGDPPGIPEGRKNPVIPRPNEQSEKRTVPLHCWSPEGLNTWVGDAAAGWIHGEWHIFYLWDKRHHGSKFGQGGHQWAHIATKDFRTWRDDGLILPLQAQWQTYGTGTPFLLDGKLALAYGLHTDRFYDQPDHPRGMTWAVSEDGIKFDPVAFSIDTLTDNPSIYNTADGRFLLHNGNELMKAEKWPEFKKAGTLIKTQKKMRMDCPAMFEWHGSCYLLRGFVGMWRGMDAAMTGQVDLAETGQDLYDGLQVPMVAPYRDDRRILAGWLSINGWGGVLGLRELVWFDDRIPGIRWLDDAMPAIIKKREFEHSAHFRKQAYFEFQMQAYSDLKVYFSGQGTPLLLHVDGKRRRAYIIPATGRHCPSLREAYGEQIQADANNTVKLNFAVEHIRNLDRPYRVRVMIREDRKWNGCIADMEIAGCRTLIHYFSGVHLESCEIKNGPDRFTMGELAGV